jgi:hypothetical protein
MTVHPALAVGVVAGGPGSSVEWTEAVKLLGRRVMELRDGVESVLSVNVVYQIPGQFLQPDFEGTRSGRFSRKEARLLVQVALPASPDGDAYEEARTRLRQAVSLAEQFAYQEGLIPTEELLPLRQLVSRL